VDREHHTAPEAVVVFVVFYDYQTGFFEQPGVVTFFTGCLLQIVPFVEAIAQLEFFYGIVFKTPFVKIAQPYRPAFLCFPQVVYKVVFSKVTDDKQASGIRNE
jgi:hypothetical protein